MKLGSAHFSHFLPTMTEVAPLVTTYCGVCTLPPEYCEFGVSLKRCKEWLAQNEPELFDKLYSEEANAHAISTLSIEREEKIHKDLEKKQAKEEKKLERELQKKLSSKIVIKRIERNRRKHIISINGLEVLNVDIKKIAKMFALKFATGASVTKNAEKKDEVLVQGDVSDEARVLIEKLLEEQDLNEVVVEQIDEKKKKKEAVAASS